VSDGICFAGLDVHAHRTAGAAVQLGSGEVWRAQLDGSSAAAIEWLRTLPGAVRAVYEAGPTGFGLVRAARAARAAGIEMMVCSPGAIPRQPGDHTKTDQRDALKLARLHAAGQLRSVLVPEPEYEALRDLVRCREDLRGDLMACRHRISKLLLRRGQVWRGPGSTWSHRHLAWLSRQRFEDPIVELVYAEHLAHHETLLARRDRLDGLLADHAGHGPWAATVARLRCLRGIDTLTAVGLVAEIGDIAAFDHPRRLASYLGLVPSERSSGTQRRQGAITKAGSSHARRLLIEAAWHYRRTPRIACELRRRQDGQPPAAI
jgi:transposase